MNHNYLVSPLVTVAGISDPARNEKTPNREWNKQPLERIVICDNNVEQSVAQGVAKRLAHISCPPQWNPKLVKHDRINFAFRNYVDATLKDNSPSPLSPLNPDCKAPIFDTDWIDKYQYAQSSVCLLFHDSPLNEEEEDNLIAIINGLVDKLEESNTLFMVCVVGANANLARVVPILRDETDLTIKSSLFALPNDLDEKEIDLFVTDLCASVINLNKKYFGMKIENIRNKRKNIVPPMNLILWDSRYTLKLAFFSEFRGDVSGAVRLYESAYDSITLLFDLGAVSAKTNNYFNARECLDLIALKIFQHILPSKLAYKRHLQHVNIVRRLLARSRLPEDSFSNLKWTAVHYHKFAELFSSFQQASDGRDQAMLQPPAGIPTSLLSGLLWLEAAKYIDRAQSFAPDSDTHTEVDDRYSIEIESACDEEECFLAAIGDLSGFKRAKGIALCKYGDWLTSKKRPDDAKQAYESARVSLGLSIWPESQRYLSSKLGDSLSLFKLGDISEFPQLDADTKSSSSLEDLFFCSGNFEVQETHVGREIKAQVSVKPKFAGSMTITKLIVNYTNGSTIFEHDESDEPLPLVVAQAQSPTSSNLNFQKTSSRIFQFAFTPVETGEIELLDVEMFAGKVTRTLKIEKFSNQWVNVDSQGIPLVKHLDLITDLRKVTVTTRPAKLRLKDVCSHIACCNELFPFHFEIVSYEEETVEATITVNLMNSDSNTTEILSKKHSLNPGNPPVLIEGSCITPTNLFELNVSAIFHTTGDKLPVKFDYYKEVDVIRPFRLTFDVVPEHLDQKWPAVFAPSLEISPIARKWYLNCTILSLLNTESLILHSTEISFDSENAEFKNQDPKVKTDLTMPHNTVTRINHSFVCSTTALGLQNLRNFEAQAVLRLNWSRESSPDVVNTLVLPSVRLNLPSQEPRVLVTAEKVGGSSSNSLITYHIENATSKLLNFSIQMSSSTYFAYQGPKSLYLKLLPYSTRSLKYILVPLGDKVIRDKRPIPDLRVYDVNYKRTLPISPGNKTVFLEQGTIFI